MTIVGLQLLGTNEVAASHEQGDHAIAYSILGDPIYEVWVPSRIGHFERNHVDPD